VAGLELFVRPASGGVQASGQDVGLDAPVPLLGQELLEPLREAVELLGRELGDGGLKFFDTHDLAVYRGVSGDGKRASILGARIAA
jgi:hypothetical protein